MSEHLLRCILRLRIRRRVVQNLAESTRNAVDRLRDQVESFLLKVAV